MVDYRQGLSILELVVYIPAFFLATFMGLRHGFGRNSGWYFFIIFAIARIVGNGCYLGTINDPYNVSLYIAYGVCNSVGLSPLLLGLLANLSRVNDSIQRKSGSAYWPMLFRVFGIASIIAMILSIIGMTQDTSDLSVGLKNPKTKAGIIIYIVSWVGFVALTVLIWFRYTDIETGEHRVLWAVTICVPVYFVRLLYSVLSILKLDERFNMFTGNTTVFLVMDIIEEIIIVYIVMLVGLTLQQREKAVHNTDKEQIQNATGPSGYNNVELQQNVNAEASYDSEPRTQRKKRPIKGGPIMMLIAFVLNKIDERRA